MEDSVSIFMANSFFRKPLTYEHNQLSNGPGGSVPCGSESEFYIVPVLNCVDDNDALLCLNVTMAFSGNRLTLPDNVQCFDEQINCVHIVPYKNYPGYVKLHIVGKMIYNWNFEHYEFSTFTEPKCVSGNCFRQQITKKMVKNGGRIDEKRIGPALKRIQVHGIYDDVHCICCPKWPEEAKEWPTRKRNGEWPLPAIVLEVVRNGCHVVCAQHRNCRDDKFQFRFSFSLAELILLRTWTPTQQIVYHMLRFFAKRELIQEDGPKETYLLCTYHLKTLMLWTCEQESSEWWKSSSVITICCKLLHKLLEWIEKGHCPNYFIPEANLFNRNIYPLIEKYFTDKLKLFCDAANLSQWFVTNYLLVCYKNLRKRRSSHESGEFWFNRLYGTILRNKRQRQLHLFDDRFAAISCACITEVCKFSDEIKIYSYVDQVESIYVKRSLVLRSEKPFIHLDSVLIMLYAANKLTCKRVLNCNDFVSDVLSVVSLGTAASTDWRSYHNFPKTYRVRLHKCHSCFVIAQEHMGKLRTPGNYPDIQLMSRLSMQCLRNSYINRDLSTSALRSATVVYMAAICFSTSQFQAAIDLCSTIFENIHNPVATNRMTKRQEEPLNAGCLIFIDDVSNGIGFILLFLNINNKLRPDYRQFELNLQITPQVFAKYIMIQSAEKMSKQLQVNWDKIPNVYLIDSFFTKAVKRKLTNIVRCRSKMCVYRRSDQIEEVLNHVTGLSLNEEISIRLLMECSLESITSLYQQISDHYGVQCYTVVNCYRALYQFKRSQYNNVLKLCDQILADPDLEDHLQKLSRPHLMIFPSFSANCLAFPNVLALRPFSAYFDEDLQCLIELQVLCHVCFPDRAGETFRKNTFDARVAEYIDTRNNFHLVFSLLLSNKSFMFQYFLGRHFLARYLKLRCLLLCDKISASEIFKAFGELKPQLPFERVIYQFLLQKLQRSFHV